MSGFYEMVSQLSVMTGYTIRYPSCNDTEREFIRRLAILYELFYKLGIRDSFGFIKLVFKFKGYDVVLFMTGNLTSHYIVEINFESNESKFMYRMRLAADSNLLAIINIHKIVCSNYHFMDTRDIVLIDEFREFICNDGPEFISEIQSIIHKELRDGVY